jgi:hypothetical protein
LVIKSILSYLSFEVFTTTITYFETPTEFPAVKICNRNLFTTEFAFQYLKDVNKNILPTIELFDEMTAKNLSYLKYSKLMDELKQSASGKISSDIKNRAKIAHFIRDILISCNFNGKVCKDDDFVIKYDNKYGNCLLYNSGMNSDGNPMPLKYSIFEGSDYGFKISLYVNYYEKLKFFNSLSALGAKIRIENSSVLTDDSLSEVRVSAGEDSDIFIDRSFRYNLPKPYRSCDIENNSPKFFDSFLYNLILNSKYEYTQQLCLRQCFQKILIDHCNCTDMRVISLLGTTNCDTFEEISCLKKVKETIFSIDGLNSVSKGDNKENNSSYFYCLALCPAECNSSNFEATISTNKIKGDFFAKYIQENKNLSKDFIHRNITPETASECIVKFNIFYKKMSYSYFIDSPKMEWISLLAYIGGIFGLFMGMSVFSFFELFILIFQIYYLNQGN